MLRRFKSIAGLGLAGIIVAGLLIGAIRLAAPFADRFRSELTTVLAESLGLEVRVGGLELRLAGLMPRLGVRDAVLSDPMSGRPRLTLDRLWVDLNPIASLRALAPCIESVILVGARLVIKRLPDGDILVTGLEGLAGKDPEAMNFFLGRGRFELADSEVYWIDNRDGAPPLHFSGVRVRFENQGERHRIGVFARGFEGRPTQLRLVGEVRGKPHRPEDWSGEVYLRWQDEDPGRMLTGRLPAGLSLESEAAVIEIWSRLEAGHFGRSLSRIEVTGLSVEGAASAVAAPPLRFDRVAGWLHWQRVDTGWQLAGEDLNLIRDGTRRPVSDLGVRYRQDDDGGWTLTGGSRFVDLADVRDLLARLPWLLPAVADRLDAIRPGGGLHDPRFRLGHRSGRPPRWAVSGRVEDLNLAAHGHFPGVRGLTAELAANERAGRLVLDDDDLVVDLPRLFPHPLQLDTAVGAIGWRWEHEGTLRIDTREVRIGNADIATRSCASVVLPADGGSPVIDLHTELRDVDLAVVPTYLPSRRLREKLVSWIEHALVGGRVPAGALLFRGALADFPFDEHQGRFQVSFPVRDGILEFHPDWPRAEALNGEVRFENREVRASFEQGRMLDSDLVHVSVHIPDLDRIVAVAIRGRAEGPFSDGLRVLGESPLRKRFGALAATFEVQGDMSLDLDLKVPLRYQGRKDPFRLTGELSWPDAAVLTMTDGVLELTDLAGKLRFTERTLEAQSVAAKLWGVPIRLDLATRRSGKNAAPITRIRARGRFPTAVLAQQFPSQAWKSLQGQARLALALELAETNFGASLPPLDFVLTSDLAGLALDLPAPLGKTEAGTRKLRLAGRLARDKALRIRGTYGDLGFDLGLDRGRDDKRRLTRGVFHLGGSPRPLPKRAGFHLDGTIVALDLGPWLDWWSGRKLLGRSDPGSSDRLRSMRVQVGRLSIAGMVLDDVRLELDHRGNHWEAKVESRELTGEAVIPLRLGDEPVQVRLAWLDLKGLLERDPRDSRASGDKQHIDPRRVHGLNLRIRELLWEENPLGRVILSARRVPSGLEFSTISLAGSSLSLQGQGRWWWTGIGPRSGFSFTARGSDLGRFLRSLEFKSLLHETPARVGLDLGWSGAPGQLSMAELEGDIRIDLGAGSLLAVEPGVGRVLGILNFNALQRRLALDFGDLFGTGYAFEKIFGQITIGNGSATITELLIEGPAADISITGGANLVARQLDQTVTVTPSLGTGAAIAGAVAAGPLVGAAMLLVDRISDGAVDKLGRHRYHLRGPWTAPEIRRKSWAEGSQDTSTTDSESKSPVPGPD